MKINLNRKEVGFLHHILTRLPYRYTEWISVERALAEQHDFLTNLIKSLKCEMDRTVITEDKVLDRYIESYPNYGPDCEYMSPEHERLNQPNGKPGGIQ